MMLLATALIVTFLIGAAAGIWLCFTIFRDQITTYVPPERVQQLAMRLDALRAAYNITLASWHAEREMYADWLRLDRPKG